MDPLELLARWDLPLVFLSALLEQVGLPVPAAPVLVAAGALAHDGALRPELVLLVGLAACVLADHAWFLAGRARGRQLLAGICRLSISPDTCVRRTDDLIAKHGAPLLLVAKFIPGVSAVAIPTAAAMGLPYRRFLMFDLLGSLMWCGAYVGAGMIFSREVHRVLLWMERIGGWSLVAIGSVFVGYLAMKLLHRTRLKRLYELVRIGPEEALALRAAEPDAVFLDARTRLARQADPRKLPGAIDYHDGDVVQVIPLEARGSTIVTFCTCPNEASAAFLAERLLRAGYTRVRVLTGGPEALSILAA